jgi:hypothetical protein
VGKKGNISKEEINDFIVKADISKDGVIQKYEL